MYSTIPGRLLGRASSRLAARSARFCSCRGCLESKGIVEGRTHWSVISTFKARSNFCFARHCSVATKQVFFSSSYYKARWLAYFLPLMYPRLLCWQTLVLDRARCSSAKLELKIAGRRLLSFFLCAHMNYRELGGKKEQRVRIVKSLRAKAKRPDCVWTRKVRTHNSPDLWPAAQSPMVQRFGREKRVEYSFS